MASVVHPLIYHCINLMWKAYVEYTINNTGVVPIKLGLLVDIRTMLADGL